MIKINVALNPKTVNMGINKSASTMPMQIGTTSGSSFATYTHDQMVASDSWEIVHNLNCYPSVSIVDTGGNVVIGEVLYESNVKLIVSFSSKFSGKAYIN